MNADSGTPDNTRDHVANQAASADNLLVRMQLLSRVVEYLPMVVYLVGPAPDAEPRYINDHIAVLLRLPARDGRQSYRLWQEHLHPEDRDEVLLHIAASRAGGTPFFAEYRMLSADGATLWVSDHARVVQSAETGESVRVGVIKEITERKMLDLELRRSVELNDAILGSVPDMIAYLDRDLRVQRASASCARAHRVAAEDLQGRTLDEFYDADAVGAIRRLLGRCLAGESQRSELWTMLPALGRRCIEMHLAPHRDAAGQVSGVVVIGRDVTDSVRVRQALDRMAHEDHLTRLPNRAAFTHRLRQTLARDHADVDSPPTSVALLFIDIDNFKQVNDSFGHSAGDRLLVELSALLAGVIAPEFVFARISGDEFAVLIEQARDQQEVAALAEALLATAAGWRFIVDDQAFTVTLSIGISLAPRDADDAESMLRAADTAMYKAKLYGRNRYQFYDLAFTDEVQQRIAFENGLRDALDNDGLVLEYQPQVAIADGGIVGVEALLRWRHPQRGMLRPVEFLTIAEGSGSIGAIGQWVMQESFSAFRDWKRAGIAPPRLALNVSAKQVADRDFPRQVEVMLSRFDMTPAEVELELSEDLLVTEGGDSQQVLEALARLGISMAIDDFGTGRSSLVYLRRLPLTRVKIDPSFVADLPDPDAAAIVRGIVSLAGSLRLEVIAEGVETVAQAHFLAANGCASAQGYLYSAALRPDALTRVLAVGRLVASC